MLEKGFKEMLDFACEQMQLTPNKQVLDFGCGNGRFVEELRERGFLAFGCDIAPKTRSKLFLERQGIEGENLSSYVKYYYNGEKIPFNDNTFPCVFSYQVFEHIKDLAFSTKELNRVLQSSGGGGGKIIVYSEFAASYPYVDCHTGLPFVFFAQRIRSRILRRLYGAFVLRFGFVTKRELPKMWRFSKKYLFYRSYRQMDRIFKENGFKVFDITFKRRRARYLLDGVGTLRELYNYKFKRQRGNSSDIGFFVWLYLRFHAFFYRLSVNRVLLLIKE